MDTASTVDRVGVTKFTTAPDREIVATMDTFLPPIEQPQGLFMKLAYYFTRRQFGKVLTPLKVHSARLPPAFGLFYTKIGKLDTKLLLPPETVLLSVNRWRASTSAFSAWIWAGRLRSKRQCMRPNSMRWSITAEQSLYRCRAGSTGLCDGVDKRQTSEPAYLCSPVRALFRT